MQFYFELSKDGGQDFPDQQKIFHVIIADLGSFCFTVLPSLGFMGSPDFSLVQ